LPARKRIRSAEAAAELRSAAGRPDSKKNKGDSVMHLFSPVRAVAAMLAVIVVGGLARQPGPSSETAIAARNHTLAAHEIREAHDPLRDELGVLHVSRSG
jgi:hypothetical protein